MANIITLIAEAINKTLLSSKLQNRQQGLATDDRQLLIKDENGGQYEFSDDQHIRNVVNNYSANVGVAPGWGGVADNVYDALQEIATTSNVASLEPDAGISVRKNTGQVVNPNANDVLTFQIPEFDLENDYDGTSKFVVSIPGIYQLTTTITFNKQTEANIQDDTRLAFYKNGSLFQFTTYQPAYDGGGTSASTKTMTLTRLAELQIGDEIEVYFQNGVGANANAVSIEVNSAFETIRTGSTFNETGGTTPADDGVFQIFTWDDFVTALGDTTFNHKYLYMRDNIFAPASSLQTIDVFGVNDISVYSGSQIWSFDPDGGIRELKFQGGSGSQAFTSINFLGNLITFVGWDTLFVEDVTIRMERVYASRNIDVQLTNGAELGTPKFQYEWNDGNFSSSVGSADFIRETWTTALWDIDPTGTAVEPIAGTYFTNGSDVYSGSIPANEWSNYPLVEIQTRHFLNTIATTSDLTGLLSKTFTGGSVSWSFTDGDVWNPFNGSGQSLFFKGRGIGIFSGVNPATDRCSLDIAPGTPNATLKIGDIAYTSNDIYVEILELSGDITIDPTSTHNLYYEKLITNGFTITDTGNVTQQNFWSNTSGGGGGASTLGNLHDVTLTSPGEGQSLVYDGAQWTNQIPIVYVEVNNGEASPITRGQPVYVSGSTGGGTPVVSLADNDGVNTYPAIGLVADNSISAGADGRVLISGILENVDTSTYNVGDAVYLDNTAGDLTSTRPTSDTEKVQKVGLVTRQAVSGSILVIGAGRTNDVPNELTSLTGVGLNDTDLGTFTGSIIQNNRDIKNAFQDVSDGIEDSTTQNPGNSIVAIYKGYDTTTIDPNTIVLNQGEFVIWTPPGSPSTEKYFIFHPTGLDGIDYTTFFQDLTFKSVLLAQDSVQNNWKISLTFVPPSSLASGNFIFSNAEPTSVLYDTFTNNATLNSISVVGFDHRAEIQDSGIDGAFLTKDTFGNYTFTDGFGTFPSVFRWDQGNQKFEWYDSTGGGSNRLDFEGQHNYLENSIVSFFNASNIQEAYFQWDSLNNTLDISTNALGGTTNKLSLGAGGELWLTSGLGHPIRLFGDTTINGELSVSNILPGTQVGLVGYDATGKLIQGTSSGGSTPGGANTEVQFNDNGVLAGDSQLTFDKTNGDLTIDHNMIVGNRLLGGVGAETTGGVLDFNDPSNRRSGSGKTLLNHQVANAPQQSAVGSNDYWHTFNFEFSSKTGSGNLTQLAIPYGSTSGMGSINYRSRFNYLGQIIYTGWRELIASHESTTERVFLFAGSTNNSPRNGDFWFDNTNFNVHENGVSSVLAKQNVNNNFSTDQTFQGDINALQVINLASYTNPSPTTGDIWRDSLSGKIQIESKIKVKGGNNSTSPAIDVLNDANVSVLRFYSDADGDGQFIALNSSGSTIFNLDTDANNGYHILLNGVQRFGSTNNATPTTGDIWLDQSLDTLRAKDSDGEFNLRGKVQNGVSPATLNPNVDIYEQSNVTALANSLTIQAPQGTPYDSQKLIYRIKDNGTARSLSWDAIFRAIGVTLPTTTTANKTIYVGCIYNNADSKWDVIAVGEEA